MTLDGLETIIKSATKGLTKINVVRYADDFIVAADTPDILENRVKPAVNAFLAERGLSLSEEKTHITHINNGFDFLGFNIRKYKEKLLIKPAKASIKSVLNKVREVISSHKTAHAAVLIKQLNPIIRGWANYFRHVVSKRIFSFVDMQVFRAIYRWVRRKHKNKSANWVNRRYFTTVRMNRWRFFANDKDRQGMVKPILLFKADSIPIKRHIKVRGAANPFLKEFEAYFEKRSTKIKPAWTFRYLPPVQYSRWT